jgi:hypothetical protein
VKSTPRLLLAGWLLVAGWLASIPGLLPMAFAAVAELDGQHGVEMRSNGEEATVILTHGAQNCGKTHEQIHHHRVFGRILTCCATSRPGQADHLVQFASCRSAQQKERQAQVAPQEMETAVAIPPIPEADIVADVFVVSEKAGALFQMALRARADLPCISARKHALLI